MFSRAHRATGKKKEHSAKELADVILISNWFWSQMLSALCSFLVSWQFIKENQIKIMKIAVYVHDYVKTLNALAVWNSLKRQYFNMYILKTVVCCSGKLYLSSCYGYNWTFPIVGMKYWKESMRDVIWHKINRCTKQPIRQKILQGNCILERIWGSVKNIINRLPPKIHISNILYCIEEKGFICKHRWKFIKLKKQCIFYCSINTKNV